GLVVALRKISSRVECGFPSLLADHAQACRSDDGPALEAVSERFARRGLGPLAAEAANQAARAYHAGGSPDGAQRAAAQARVLARRFDPQLSPTLADLQPSPELSRREEAVARLAATGLSNSEIAERLVVSSTGRSPNWALGLVRSCAGRWTGQTPVVGISKCSSPPPRQPPSCVASVTSRDAGDGGPRRNPP